MSPFKFAFGGGCPTVLSCGKENVEDCLELQEQLGKGHFGVVRACKDKRTGERLACKSISKDKLTCWEEREDVRREVEIMDSLGRHPNIVTLHRAFEDAEHVHLAMDCCDGGELFDEISARGPLSESEAAQVLEGIARGVAHCHSMGILHRDLKPENILLVHEGESEHKRSTRLEVKLADFGLSVRLRPGQLTSGVAGSPYYLAPEVLLGRYGLKADIWSMGVILFMMLSESAPFYGEKEEEILNCIKAGVFEFRGPVWEEVSEGAKSLISRMLQKDPRLRPSAEEILRDPWLVCHTRDYSGPPNILRSVSARDTKEEECIKPGLDAAGLSVQQCASLPRVSSVKASQLLTWFSPQVEPALPMGGEGRRAGGASDDWEVTSSQLQELQEGLKAFSLDGEKTEGDLPPTCSVSKGRCSCKCCGKPCAPNEEIPRRYEPTAVDAITWIFGL